MEAADLIRQFSPESVYPELDSPSFRQAIYRLLHRRVEPSHGPILRAAFEQEIAYRKSGRREQTAAGDIDYFENIYWCGFLLSRIRDVRDVTLLWRAKGTDMDVGTALDIQCLVSAGVRETLAFLLAQNDLASKGAVDCIKHCLKSGDFDNLPEWHAFRMNYYQ